MTKEEKKQMKKQLKTKKEGFFGEFRKFITRGNVVDMAVGVIIGGAFSKIVTTLTTAILMPFIGWVLGDNSVEEIKTILRAAEYDTVDPEKIIKPEIALNWGLFIQAIIDFLLIALVVFLIVKTINNVRERIDYVKNYKTKAQLEAEAKAAAEAKELADKQAAEELAQKLVADKEKATDTSTNELLVEIINLLKK